MSSACVRDACAAAPTYGTDACIRYTFSLTHFHNQSYLASCEAKFSGANLKQNLEFLNTSASDDMFIMK